VRQVRARAAAAGVAEEAIESAMDGGDPKAAMVRLVTDRAVAAARAEAVGARPKGKGKRPAFAACLCRLAV
jgi:hypothetical protein